MASTKRRKPLQLQFSIHEKSDGEENEDESVFLDNNPEGVASVVSDDDEDVTTSPSLTFGVVDPRGCSKSDYRYTRGQKFNHTLAEKCPQMYCKLEIGFFGRFQC